MEIEKSWKYKRLQNDKNQFYHYYNNKTKNKIKIFVNKYWELNIYIHNAQN